VVESILKKETPLRQVQDSKWFGSEHRRMAFVSARLRSIKFSRLNYQDECSKNEPALDFNEIILDLVVLRSPNDENEHCWISNFALE
jgi:hypothetical protein